MTHEVAILFNEIYLARPWGAKCTVCGVFSANVDESEAQESKRIHEGQRVTMKATTSNTPATKIITTTASAASASRTP